MEYMKLNDPDPKKYNYFIGHFDRYGRASYIQTIGYAKYKDQGLRLYGNDAKKTENVLVYCHNRYKDFDYLISNSLRECVCEIDHSDTLEGCRYCSRRAIVGVAKKLKGSDEGLLHLIWSSENGNWKREFIDLRYPSNKKFVQV